MQYRHQIDTMTTVTLEQVAARAGVSASTVSRAFGRPDAVRADTLERVLGAARELGYTPPASRERVPAWIVGMSVPDIANPVVMPMIKAAQRELRREGSAIMLADVDESPEGEATLVRRLAERVNGLVLASTRLSDAEVREIAAITPAVLINREVRGVPGVTFDEVGLHQAVAHLAALGHERIHYLGGPGNSRSDRVRTAAIRASAGKLGVEVVVIGPSQPTYEAGLRLADIVVSVRATAVVAFNDIMALGLLSGLRIRRIAVPGHVSVTGIDDVWLDDAAAPPLTSVRIPWQASGAAAVTLLERIRDGVAEIASPQLPTELVVRASTGPRRTEP